jgi:transcriptional regulator with XRE-family HTH domain
VRHIGAAIKAKRKPLMTQGEFAAKLGLTQPSVSAWEREDSMPTADILPKIARILKCSVDDLVIGLDAEYDRVRATYPVPAVREDGASNASEAYAPATPRRADDGPATRHVEPAIPESLAADSAAPYLFDIARELAETTAARLRAIAEALVAREAESPDRPATGVRTDADPHHQPHARQRRTHRRGA